MPGPALGWFHLFAAIAGLALGAAVVVARKGTRLHRQLGWGYVASMVAVNASALLIYRLLGHFGPFHAAALFSLFTLIAGMIPVRRTSPPRRWLFAHATWMAGSYVGLWAAAVAETTSRLELLPFWWSVLLATLVVLLTGLLLTLRGVPVAIANMRRPPSSNS